MNIKKLFKSILNAIKGVRYVFLHEQNFRIQIFFTIIVLCLAWFFGLRKSEWIVILLLILLVLILELLNSAVEKLSDIVTPRLSNQIKVVKDIMAAVVLISSIGAFLIGLIIFWPYVIELFGLKW